jgi:hypothetical protein
MPNEWTIESHEGAGPVRFGMKAAEVRATVGRPATAFRKDPADAHPADAFDAVGVHVFYDAAGRCEAVELFGPASPVFAGLRLLALPFREVEDALAARDPGLRRQVDGLVSLACGLSVNASPERGEAPARSVLAFRRGYLDGVKDALDALAR